MECPNSPQLFDEEDTIALSILSAVNEFCLSYRKLHKYVSMILCVFGLLANCTHIWILRRPSMLRSSVHTVLICIALADSGTMGSYAIYLLRYEFCASSTGGYSYGWVLLLKLHVVLSTALHSISLYLLVFITYIRICSVQTQRSQLLETRVAGFISLLISFAIFALCIPTLLAHDIVLRENSPHFIELKEIHPTDLSESYPSSISNKYSIGLSKMFVSNDCFLLKLNLWLTGIIMKVIPCILLLCLTYCLLVKLAKNKKKRVALLRERAKDRVYKDRTTCMLLLMVSSFLCTELPQGIIAIFNAIYTAQFHFYVYLTIADILDVLSLINCHVGFTVYFCTCSRYRRTFYSILPYFGAQKREQARQL
uniref:G-protein coupled receptors family 1 profile domain-containing protein n=1 Tax=Wuchereria bancrofti TaxID=6293 RepID=A0AAF5PWQ6_WUCBA